MVMTVCFWLPVALDERFSRNPNAKTGSHSQNVLCEFVSGREHSTASRQQPNTITHPHAHTNPPTHPFTHRPTTPSQSASMPSNQCRHETNLFGRGFHTTQGRGYTTRSESATGNCSKRPMLGYFAVVGCDKIGTWTKYDHQTHQKRDRSCTLYLTGPSLKCRSSTIAAATSSRRRACSSIRVVRCRAPPECSI